MVKSYIVEYMDINNPFFVSFISGSFIDNSILFTRSMLMCFSIGHIDKDIIFRFKVSMGGRINQQVIFKMK